MNQHNLDARDLINKLWLRPGMKDFSTKLEPWEKDMLILELTQALEDTYMKKEGALI